MAVKMRLRREGKRKQPFYRIVVADVRSPRDGRFIEDLGYYHPIREPSEISIDRERALYWLRNGVQPSQAVVNLLRIEGIWEEFRPGQADPNAERRQRRAEKRAQQQQRLDAARAAQQKAEQDTEEAKAAADAARGDEIAEQATEEAVQPPSTTEPGEEAAVVEDTEAGGETVSAPGGAGGEAAGQGEAAADAEAEEESGA